MFRCYLKPILYLLNFLVPLNLRAVQCLSIAPRVAREKDGYTSLCVERQENEIRVRVDRLRGSPISHLLSHLTISDNGRSPEYSPEATSCGLRPPETELASPLGGVVFHVPDPRASCWDIDSDGETVVFAAIYHADACACYA
jgi:hypothetical protein